MLKPSLVSILSLASMIGLLACTVTQGGASPAGADGGPVAADGGPATGGERSLSCLQLLQCATGSCTEADTACQDACYLRGTADAKAQADALIACAKKEACADGSCVETKCKAPLDACGAGSIPASNGKPLGGAPATGNVPADLVGSWQYSSYGFTNALDLNADGTGTWSISANVDSGIMCRSEASAETGPTVVTADVITVYASDVQSLLKPCNGSLTKKTGEPVTEVFSYVHPDAETLILTDQACKSNINAVDCSYTLKRK